MFKGSTEVSTSLHVSVSTGGLTNKNIKHKYIILYTVYIHIYYIWLKAQGSSCLASSAAAFGPVRFHLPGHLVIEGLFGQIAEGEVINMDGRGNSFCRTYQVCGGENCFNWIWADKIREAMFAGDVGNNGLDLLKATRRPHRQGHRKGPDASSSLSSLLPA